MPLAPRYAEMTGIVLLGGVALYAAGSFYGFPPVKIRSLTLTYPRPADHDPAGDRRARSS